MNKDFLPLIKLTLEIGIPQIMAGVIDMLDSVIAESSISLYSRKDKMVPRDVLNELYAIIHSSTSEVN
jgi:hypothetical protein